MFARTIIATVFASLSFAAAAGNSAPDVVGVNLGSSHSVPTYFDHSVNANRTYRNSNFGLYAIWVDNRARGNTRFVAGVGAYANSVYRTTVHAEFGVEHDLYKFSPSAVLRVGALGGVATGYAQAFGDNMPVLFGTFTPIGNLFALVPVGNDVSVRVSFIPAVKDATSVAHLSIEARF